MSKAKSKKQSKTKRAPMPVKALKHRGRARNGRARGRKVETVGVLHKKESKTVQKSVRIPKDTIAFLEIERKEVPGLSVAGAIVQIVEDYKARRLRERAQKSA